jgi:hypothetical protein
MKIKAFFGEERDSSLDVDSGYFRVGEIIGNAIQNITLELNLFFSFLYLDDNKCKR